MHNDRHDRRRKGLLTEKGIAANDPISGSVQRKVCNDGRSGRIGSHLSDPLRAMSGFSDCEVT